VNPFFVEQDFKLRLTKHLRKVSLTPQLVITQEHQGMLVPALLKAPTPVIDVILLEGEPHTTGLTIIGEIMDCRKICKWVRSNFIRVVKKCLQALRDYKKETPGSWE
jgi:hypothetical protein